MPDSSLSTKVFLFRLNNYSIEKEHTLLEKFEAYGLNDHWQGYSPPGHPEIRGLYFVPATQELKTQAERLISESVTLNMSAVGTYDLFDIPFSDIEKNKGSIPIAYIILGILILLLVLGVLK
ncbi:hypothetical protein [Leptospira noguchii]|uniref:Uncharacterized protein n=1 Tax=Leptospira noguchii serovar Panama str. CZ214 TaxID=1001595 RepID=T0FMG8_9LEPT|nr:hypothetical protein [Leptospira noguchii]EQA70705.1 hypothetical protein LEP1GSC059_0193 [Leptospira noguchii serovar Panama str. CZ214]